ncbi:hypothetical protein MOC02_08110 [Bacillus inaquosorum]|uniref:hypothetical protein n=1 Tax=Bacillus inaquosorum TaxID=483913 RepID=UPI00227F6F43|nr:hypothetical protein [Bacillus inaquosorum]MCY8083260.1 hypothetical protein [Bacillus inaquosorum]MCY8702013.1 hypothetical protein [Bacillus inaquosorum]
MSFETKYLIRWGIPGWFFMFWGALTFFLVNQSVLLNMNFGHLSKIFGAFISLGLVGIVIGYALNQLYFLVFWIVGGYTITSTINMIDNYPRPNNWGINKSKDYFHLEYIWHKQLLKIEEDARTYISERYRHLLSTVHAYGTMVVVQGFAAIITIVYPLMNFGFSIYLHVEIFALWAIEAIVGMVFARSFVYYTNNLRALQGYILNDLLNNKIPEIKK